MPKTTIQTNQATRIAKHLTNHFKHKVTVTETDMGYFVNMAGADVTFTPTDNELQLNMFATKAPTAQNALMMKNDFASSSPTTLIGWLARLLSIIGVNEFKSCTSQDLFLKICKIGYNPWFMIYQ